MPRHAASPNEPLESIVARFRTASPNTIKPPILAGLDADLAQLLREAINTFNNAVYCWLGEIEGLLSNFIYYDFSKSRDLDDVPVFVNELKKFYKGMIQWWHAAGDVKDKMTAKEKELKEAGRSWATWKRFGDVGRKMWDTYAEMAGVGLQICERLDRVMELRGYRSGFKEM